MKDILPNSTMRIVVDGHTDIDIELPGYLVDPVEYRLLRLWDELTDDLISSMPTGMEDLFGDDPRFLEYKELSGWDER